jgi:hypothetical protein
VASVLKGTSDAQAVGTTYPSAQTEIRQRGGQPLAAGSENSDK